MSRQMFRVDKDKSKLTGIESYTSDKVKVLDRAGIKYHVNGKGGMVFPDTICFDAEFLIQMSDHFKLTFNKGTITINDS